MPCVVFGSKLQLQPTRPRLATLAGLASSSPRVHVLDISVSLEIFNMTISLSKSSVSIAAHELLCTRAELAADNVKFLLPFGFFQQTSARIRHTLCTSFGFHRSFDTPFQAGNVRVLQIFQKCVIPHTRRYGNLQSTRRCRITVAFAIIVSGK